MRKYDFCSKIILFRTKYFLLFVFSCAIIALVGAGDTLRPIRKQSV